MRFVMVLFLLFSMSDGQLENLARSGRIEENAPVKASSEITIHANPERIWALLTDVKDWPTWQKDISKAEMSGPLQAGTDFTWTSGTQIRSRLALVQAPQALAWTGQAYKAKAIHVWKLERLSGGQTRVTTAESMDGFMLAVFYSSKKLKESQERWLGSLKAAAER